MFEARGAFRACPLGLILMCLPAPGATAQSVTDEGFVTAGQAVRLYYRVVGHGPDPVLLIHGGPGFTSDYLADDMDTLARSHALFIYDQRGIGRSTLVGESSALAAQRYV